MATTQTKLVRYFVGTCDEPVQEISAASAAEAAKEFAEYMAWDDDPDYHSGESIYVVPISGTTEFLFQSQNAYTIEKVKV